MKKTSFILSFVLLFILCFIPTNIKAAQETITSSFADNQLYSSVKAQLAFILQKSTSFGGVKNILPSTPQTTSALEVETIPVQTIRLNKTSLTLQEKQTEQLQAIILPEEATNYTITWSSSNSSIASVDGSGKVTAIRVGTTNITATVQDTSGSIKQAVCEIKVIVPLQSITLDKSSLTLIEGQSGNLQVAFHPLNATNKKVTWSSKDSTIASIDDTGKVTGHKAGTTQIIVTAQDDFWGIKQAICHVTVTPFIPLQSIILNKETLILKVGQTAPLTATIVPSDATVKTTTWRSSDSSVASIGYGFIVTAHQPGTAQIIVTAQDKTLGTIQAICHVTVIAEDVVSSQYNIEQNTISHISPNTEAQDFLANLQTPFSCQVLDASGNRLSNHHLVGTGMYLTLSNGNRYVLVVTGDVTGDGKITATDLFSLKRHVVKLQSLTDAYAKAADMNDSASISATDLLRMKQAMVGLLKF